MVYYRFIKKKYGPYAYISVRTGRKVVSVYLGAVSSKVAGVHPNQVKHKPGEHVIESKKELLAIEERARVTLELKYQGVAITGGSRAYQEIVKNAYSSEELAELGIKNINIVSNEDDWKIITGEKLPDWKKDLLIKAGKQVTDVLGMLDSRGTLFLQQFEDKEAFIMVFHHEIGQARYRKLDDVTMEFFHEVRKKIRFEEYPYDPEGGFPGDNDRYAFLYTDFKIMGKTEFLKEYRWPGEYLKVLGFI